MLKSSLENTEQSLQLDQFSIEKFQYHTHPCFITNSTGEISCVNIAFDEFFAAPSLPPPTHERLQELIHAATSGYAVLPYPQGAETVLIKIHIRPYRRHPHHPPLGFLIEVVDSPYPATLAEIDSWPRERLISTIQQYHRRFGDLTLL